MAPVASVSAVMARGSSKRQCKGGHAAGHRIQVVG
jgi:hypothetical protein